MEIINLDGFSCFTIERSFNETILDHVDGNIVDDVYEGISTALYLSVFGSVYCSIDEALEYEEI